MRKLVLYTEHCLSRIDWVELPSWSGGVEYQDAYMIQESGVSQLLC